MKHRIISLAMVLVLIMGLASFPVQAEATKHTFTEDADFDEGTLVGVQHDTVHDQLQLSSEVVTFPFIWVANSGESTVSKIDTETGRELGRYRTGPGVQAAENPSRTTIDLNGDLWVGNRNSATAVKIALFPSGDTNNDGMFMTSQDTNDDGFITEDELLPWGQDDAVLMRIPVDSQVRALAVDASNNVWIGGYGGNMGYYDGTTGVQLKNIGIGRYCYGAFIDRNGTLWVSNQGYGTITRIDNPTGSETVTYIESPEYNTSTSPYLYERWVYGIAIDFNGKIYATSYMGQHLRKLDPATNSWGWNVPTGQETRGVAAGLDGDIWVANSGDDNVMRFDPSNGNLKATISVIDPAQPNTRAVPTGVAVDATGKLWVTNRDSSTVMRIDPATNEVDLILPDHLGAYNYSDMTGIISRNLTTKTGNWVVTFDGEAEDTVWGVVSWKSEEPAGTRIIVECRSSNDQVLWSTWETAISGVPLSATPDARYLQIKALLIKMSGDVSPVLYELTINPTGEKIPVDIEIKPEDVNINGNGVVNVFVYNKPGFDVRDIEISSLRFGPTGTEARLVKEPNFSNKKVKMDFIEGELLIPADTPGKSIMNLYLTGWLKNGTFFEGTDTVRIGPNSLMSKEKEIKGPKAPEEPVTDTKTNNSKKK